MPVQDGKSPTCTVMYEVYVYGTAQGGRKTSSIVPYYKSAKAGFSYKCQARYDELEIHRFAVAVPHGYESLYCQ